MNRFILKRFILLILTTNIGLSNALKKWRIITIKNRSSSQLKVKRLILRRNGCTFYTKPIFVPPHNHVCDLLEVDPASEEGIKYIIEEEGIYQRFTCLKKDSADVTHKVRFDIPS